ncbi:hypothetical protein ED312_09850 [Sinomicrobium pectinilyticum]|uniref:Uncharacterized protein n=1 Tax=Sinomicrobium pectinilyticum TaxID=1084421 RepID=A0A3N0EJB9_SINP1|nr:hypothetical protein ED312_09850 [Sinomicrobium pectinilyticum]
MLASQGKGLLLYLPPASYNKFVTMMDRYFYGLEKELMCKVSHRYPGIKECNCTSVSPGCCRP